MSHSFVDDSLVKNPVSPLSSPMSGKSEEEQEDDELHNSVESRENGLYGQEEEVEEARAGNTRTLSKALRQNKCESTSLRTILSGVGALNV